jgi:hypothetical protein
VEQGQHGREQAAAQQGAQKQGIFTLSNSQVFRVVVFRLKRASIEKVLCRLAGKPSSPLARARAPM